MPQLKHISDQVLVAELARRHTGALVATLDLAQAGRAPAVAQDDHTHLEIRCDSRQALFLAAKLAQAALAKARFEGVSEDDIDHLLGLVGEDDDPRHGDPDDPAFSGKWARPFTLAG